MAGMKIGLFTTAQLAMLWVIFCFVEVNMILAFFKGLDLVSAEEIANKIDVDFASLIKLGCWVFFIKRDYFTTLPLVW